MSCILMKELLKIEGVKELPYESIEQIRMIICGTHNGICIDKFIEIEK